MPRRKETRTYKDRAEYLKLAVAKRRRKLKLLAIEHLGGKCSRCGYDRCVQALSFHHKNPNDKLFGISAKGITRSWASVQKEIDKCELLCANCHMEIHHA